MKGHKKLNKKETVDASAVGDDRFAEVYSDPRFMKVPQKMKKVVIDERFKKALKKDKEFNLVQKVDKYGKRVNKQDNTMSAFYHLDDEEEKGATKGKKSKVEESDRDEVPQPAGASKYYDDDGKFKWDAQSSSEEEDGLSDEESSEDVQDIKPSKREIHSDDEEDEESDMDTNVQKMLPKTVPDSEVVIGKRLALTNMDWDNLTAIDILSIFNSLCKGGDMFIRKVEIYPSLFGLE